MADKNMRQNAASADQAARPTSPAPADEVLTEAEAAVKKAVETGGTASQDNHTGEWVVSDADKAKTRVMFGDDGQWAVVAKDGDKLMYTGQAYSREAAVLDASGPQKIAEARLSE